MISALEMFKIGIGPSSSHTIGPMKASLQFAQKLADDSLLSQVKSLKVELFGSLALTGEGHGTVLAILNGLSGFDPVTVDPDLFVALKDYVTTNNQIKILGLHQINFSISSDVLLHKDKSLSEHPNGMIFGAYDCNSVLLLRLKYFSIGGGFIANQFNIQNILNDNLNESAITIPYPYKTAHELFGFCAKHKISIAQLVIANEKVNKSETQIYDEALLIAKIMHESVVSGLNANCTVMPGVLGAKRRAKDLYNKINLAKISTAIADQRLLSMIYAMAVNEENACFRRIVTAPTNGSAGTIAGVLEYYRNFCEGVTEQKIIEFILTAGAIGVLYKYGASISAAEVGCQGEIGVACSMAAAALTAVSGGSLIQIEKAAEIAMEHNLGMTCDPIGGLVQIPCIERNGVAASKAIDIAGFSLLENTRGVVSLDSVIKTMLQTGRDMSVKYKETSLGGLAVNIINC